MRSKRCVCNHKYHNSICLVPRCDCIKFEEDMRRGYKWNKGRRYGKLGSIGKSKGDMRPYG